MKSAMVKVNLIALGLPLTSAFVSGPIGFDVTGAALARRSTMAFAATNYKTEMTTQSELTREGTVIDLMDSNYEELFHSEKPLLIDAYATWCGPCKLIEPILHKCAEEHSGSITVSRWNVESPNVDLKVELLLQGANPSALPTLILVNAGNAKIIHEGMISQDKLNHLLETMIPKSTNSRTKNIGSTPQAIRDDNLRTTSHETRNSMRQPGFIGFAAHDLDDYMMGGFTMTHP